MLSRRLSGNKLGTVGPPSPKLDWQFQGPAQTMGSGGRSWHQKCQFFIMQPCFYTRNTHFFKCFFQLLWWAACQSARWSRPLWAVLYRSVNENWLKLDSIINQCLDKFKTKLQISLHKDYIPLGGHYCGSEISHKIWLWLNRHNFTALISVFVKKGPNKFSHKGNLLAFGEVVSASTYAVPSIWDIILKLFHQIMAFLFTLRAM